MDFLPSGPEGHGLAPTSVSSVPYVKPWRVFSISAGRREVLLDGSEKGCGLFALPDVAAATATLNSNAVFNSKLNGGTS